VQQLLIYDTVVKYDTERNTIQIHVHYWCHLVYIFAMHRPQTKNLIKYIRCCMLDIQVMSWLRSLVASLSPQEDQVCAWVSSCGICGAQSCTGTGVSQSSSVFLHQYRSTMALHTHISIIWRMAIGLLVASDQKHSLTASTWTWHAWYEASTDSYCKGICDSTKLKEVIICILW
jgi:hypothetical protein